MMIDIIALYFLSFCLFVGACFVLVGAIGLVKFNESMPRLHAPTKVGTVGVGALLLGSMIHSYLLGEGWSMHELLIMAFLFVTAPISAHFIAKVAIHKRDCVEPPLLGGEKTWSTINISEDVVKDEKAK